MVYVGIALDGELRWVGDVDAESDTAADAAARSRWPGLRPAVRPIEPVEANTGVRFLRTWVPPVGRLRKEDAMYYAGRLNGYYVAVSDRSGRWQVSVMEPELLVSVHSCEVASPEAGAAAARTWVAANPRP